MITILDDDLPGTLRFMSDDLAIEESREDHEIAVRVMREKGSSGTIGFTYRTEPDTATSPHDYQHVENTIQLEEGQHCYDIMVCVKAVGRYERTEQFRVLLSDPTGGALFDATTDGKEDCNICTVQIKANSSQKDRVDVIKGVLKLNWDKNKLGTSNWKEQFTGALYCNGSPEDQADAGVFDWILHVISVPWKVLFACIPPTDFGGGWACFCAALSGIGLLTGAIGDLAGLLGCSMGLKDSVTAITFVALGTSLPDTFASKAAAEQDPYADASIGNVTGSNSVNVFLGLGLPWAFGAIFWHANGPTLAWQAKYANCRACSGDANLFGSYPDGGFAVPAGSLGFSVTIFTSCGLACIACLIIRRKICGGELGGPSALKWGSAAFCVFLWFLYVSLVAWQVYSSED